jgi:hypothetical protein
MFSLGKLSDINVSLICSLVEFKIIIFSLALISCSGIFVNVLSVIKFVTLISFFILLLNDLNILKLID